MSSGDQGRFPAMSRGVVAGLCPWHSRPWWALLLSTLPHLFISSPLIPPSSSFREFKSISGVKGKAARFSLPGARLGSLLGVLGCPPPEKLRPEGRREGSAESS